MKERMSELGLGLFAKVMSPRLEATRKTLRRLREEVGLTRGQLALILGTSPNVVRRWEDGTRNPSAPARRLIQLVNRIHFSPENLGGAEFIGSVGRLLHMEAGLTEAEEKESLISEDIR